MSAKLDNLHHFAKFTGPELKMMWSKLDSMITETTGPIQARWDLEELALDLGYMVRKPVIIRGRMMGYSRSWTI